MDIQSEKLNFIRWFSGITDQSVIKEFTTLKREKETDWWDTTSVEERTEIEEGIAQAERGEMKPHDLVMDKYKKWH